MEKWGTQGSGDGQFYSPSDIAIGIDGTVCVIDQNNRIQRLLLTKTAHAFVETTLPITQQPTTTQEYVVDLGVLNVKGRLFLQ